VTFRACLTLFFSIILDDIAVGLRADVLTKVVNFSFFMVKRFRATVFVVFMRFSSTVFMVFRSRATVFSVFSLLGVHLFLDGFLDGVSPLGIIGFLVFAVSSSVVDVINGSVQEFEHLFLVHTFLSSVGFKSSFNSFLVFFIQVFLEVNLEVVLKRVNEFHSFFSTEVFIIVLVDVIESISDHTFFISCELSEATDVGILRPVLVDFLSDGDFFLGRSILDS